MNQIHTKHTRALALAPSTRGFGFAVMEGEEILVDWGVKRFKTDKNKKEIKKAKELIDHYQPNVIILPKEVTQRRRRARRRRGENLSRNRKYFSGPKRWLAKPVALKSQQYPPVARPRK